MKQFVVAVLLAMVLVTPVIAAPEDGEFTITAQDIAEMDDSDRNRFMSVYNGVQQKKVEAQQALEMTKEVVTTESVQEGIDFLSGIDFDSLSANGVKLADAILAFCTRLGVGVEKFVTSSFGVVVLFGIAYKMGMVGAAIDVMTCGLGLLFFTYVLWALNTSKTVKLKEEAAGEDGKLKVISTKEIREPRFGRIFTKYIYRDNNTADAAAEAVGWYRVWASVFCLIFMIVLICVI